MERSWQWQIGYNIYSMSLVARGDHGVDVWADGETRRGGEGNGDGRRAAAFIPWKLIPPFVHLSQSDKMGRLWLWCPVFFFLHSPPSFNFDGFILGREERGKLLIRK